MSRTRLTTAASAAPRVPAMAAAEAPRVLWLADAFQFDDSHSRSPAHRQDRMHSRGVPGSRFLGWWASG